MYPQCAYPNVQSAATAVDRWLREARPKPKLTLAPLDAGDEPAPIGARHAGDIWHNDMEPFWSWVEQRDKSVPHRGQPDWVLGTVALETNGR